MICTYPKKLEICELNCTKFFENNDFEHQKNSY